MNDLPEHLRDPMKVLERGRQIEEGGGLRLEQPSSNHSAICKSCGETFNVDLGHECPGIQPRASKEMYLDAVDIAQLIDAHKREMDNGDDEPAIVLSKREADDTIEALKRLSTAHEPFPSLEHEAGGSRERGTSPNRSCGTAGQSGPASSLHDAAQPSAFAGAPMRVLEWPELSKSPDCPKPQRYDLRNTSLGYEPDYEMVRDEGGEWVRWDDIEPHLSTTQPPAESERTLRRLLAFAHSGGHLYGDDGELQDSRLPHPIDYVRDSVAEIERKINARGMDRLLEESSLLRRCYNEIPNPEHESDFDKRQRLRQLLQDLAKIIEWLPRAAVTTEGGRDG